MNLAEAFLQELDHEAVATRKAIARVPASQFGWKPHAKSMSFGRLASHIAEIPGWVVSAIEQDVFAITGSFTAYEAKSSEDLVKMFDDNLAAARASLKKSDNAHLAQQWKMTVNGNVFVDMPRSAVIRMWVLNHMVHHRGQLSVYLRQNDLPVPAMYGASADEQPGQ
jgi:uncharacterized damage-inducible protein DinB